MASDAQEVNLYIGARGQPVSVNDNLSLYKDYIVKQNLVLQEENKALAETERELKARIDELEEAADMMERQTVRLKQYVRNFHDVSEIHREMSEADYEYFISVVKEEERQKLLMSNGWNINPSFIFITIMVIYHIMLLLDTSLMYILPIIAVAYTYYMQYIHQTITKHADVHACSNANITNLIKLRDSKSKDLQGLHQTMDIIGKFIDDAL